MREHAPRRAYLESSVLLAAAAALCFSCGSPELGQSPNGGAAYECTADADCPSGLVCRLQQCVSPEDERPPEQEQAHTFLEPTASAAHVWVLAPDSASVSIIDAKTLAIETVPLPEEPFALRILPGSEAAVVLSRRGEALSVVSIEGGAPTVVSQRVERQYQGLALSPDGRWALLYTPEGFTPDAGAEGIVALVDVDALAAGRPEEALERAAGRRHTDVFFRMVGAVAADAVVVGQQEIAVLDLSDPAARPVPERIPLPEAYTDVGSREVVPSPDGSRALIRSFVSPDLAVFDVATRSLGAVTLPGTATDLDVSTDGSLAIVALRATSQVAWFPLPEGLTEPSALHVVDVAGTVPGQVDLSADGRLAVIFTSTEGSESFGWLDLGTAEVTVFDRLDKLVRAVGLAPGGRMAVVLHRPDPESTVADPYEREVDREQGYSLVDLDAGYAQLKLTGAVAPVDVVFAPDGRHAAVTLEAEAAHRLDTVDLETLVTGTLELASAPQFAGAMPTEDGLGDRVWVTQAHPAGRISFVDLSTSVIRTVTGYELNADIQ